MSNDSSKGGPLNDPSGAAGGRAEDGYPTQPVPHRPYPAQPNQQPPNPQQGQPPQRPPGPPPGYPQQGQPQQGPPWFSQQGHGPQQGQGYPPQGNPYIQGQPPQGYGQPYQQSYDQGQGAYGQPPKKSATGMIVAIIAIIVALILAVVVGLVWSQRGQVATPPIETSTAAVETPTDEPGTPTEDATTQSGVTETSKPGGQITRPTQGPISDDPAPPEPPPAMPSQVGDWVALVTPTSDLGSYESTTTDDTVTARHKMGDLTPKQVAGLLEGAKEIGVWTCGANKSDSTVFCYGEARGGLVTLTGIPDVAGLATWGDQFLAAWK